MLGCLPESVCVNNTYYRIRTDYRNVLQVFEALGDVELDDYCKNIVMAYLMFEVFSGPDDVISAVKSGFDLCEANNQLVWFISAGKSENEERKSPVPLYDWEQDEQMIFSAINKVAGREIRELDYLHWWTFLGYFNEIEEGMFTHIVGIRKKLAEAKKLDKWEKEFYKNNKKLIILKKRLSEKEAEEEKAFKNLIDNVLG